MLVTYFTNIYTHTQSYTCAAIKDDFQDRTVFQQAGQSTRVERFFSELRYIEEIDIAFVVRNLHQRNLSSAAQVHALYVDCNLRLTRQLLHSRDAGAQCVDHRPHLGGG